jgi:hypothetical protein
VTRKSITTSHAAACDVCGGRCCAASRPTSSSGGGAADGCELCTARATHEGWIREGLDLSAGAAAAARARRSSALAAARTRPRGAAAARRERRPPTAGGAAATAARAGLRAAAQRATCTRADERALKMSARSSCSTASEHPRTVAGVARSLGRPLVAIRPSATEGSVVGITVAWELSWYRYEVDLADEAAGVRVIAQGTELTELDDADRVPNGAADDHGGLALAAA